MKIFDSSSSKEVLNELGMNFTIGTLVNTLFDKNSNIK